MVPRCSDRAASRASRRMFEVYAEAGVGRLGAGDRLEHEIDGGAAADDLQRVGDMCQYTGLGGNIVPQAQRFQHVQQGDAVGDAVGGGIDADHRVAAAEQQAIDRCGTDAAEIVGGMVGLQAGAEAAGQALGVAERRGDAAAAGDADEILVAHQFCRGGGHFGRDGGGEFGQALGGRIVGQQPVAKAADGQMGDRGEGGGVVGVEDQAGDLVGFVRNDRVVQENRQRQIRQDRAGGDALGVGCGGQAGEFVARTAVGGFGEDVLQVGEAVALAMEVAEVGWHHKAPQ